MWYCQYTYAQLPMIASRCDFRWKNAIIHNVVNIFSFQATVLARQEQHALGEEQLLDTGTVSVCVD